MTNYSEVKPYDSLDLECLLEVYNLFALFDAPVHVIFIDKFINNIMHFKDVFKRYFTYENIFFSCKSNKSYALLEYATRNNCGIEVSSNYELKDALKYTHKIIASGPGKDKAYLENAIENEVLISVDDIEELKEIKLINKNVKVLLRISDLLGKLSRFGINILQINKCLDIIKESKITLVGFSFHINNYSLKDRIKAIDEVINLVNEKKIKIKYIDIGGGLPTRYCSKKSFENFKKNNNENMYFKKHFIDNYYPYYSELADEEALDHIFRNTYEKLNRNNIEIIVEPGRSLLNNVGISIYEVQYLKTLYNNDKLIITNGNINCLSEQWFNSDYLIEPLLYVKDKNRKKETIFASVAGNLCLEQDMLTWRKIKFDYEPQKGDYLIYFNTAGYQMDSNESEFHKIPLITKYIVQKKDSIYVIKEDKEYDS